MYVDIFVLNYNGADYILDCISSLLLSLKNSRHNCQLSIIDNHSTDHSVQIIKDKFPEVEIVSMAENRVLCSFNDVVRQSKADLVFLLNNDLKADPFFIDPLVMVFQENKDVFLVAAKSFLFDGSYEGGRSVPFVKFGFFGTTCRFRGFERYMDQFGFTFAAGFGAFDRNKFIELGGYDDLYLPGRLEDADLAFRAWKKGWKSYYQPQSILYHRGAKSFKDRFGSRGTMELAYQNTFLFMWKNLLSPYHCLTHVCFFLPRLVWMLLKGRFEFLTGFIKAVGKSIPAFERRQREKMIQYQYSDSEVISFFKYGN